MSKRIPLQEVLPVMQEVLNSGGEFNMVTAGMSMYPLLRDRKDSVVLIKPGKSLKKYDVALYRRNNGAFVLHRVVGIAKDGYIFCGDNQLVKERGISHSQVIAVMKAYVKDGKRVSCQSFGYRIYTVQRCCLRPVRKVGTALRRLAGALKRNLLNK